MYVLFKNLNISLSWIIANIPMRGVTHSNTTVRIASMTGFISLFTSLCRNLASRCSGVLCRNVPWLLAMALFLPGWLQSRCNHLTLHTTTPTSYRPMAKRIAKSITAWWDTCDSVMWRRSSPRMVDSFFVAARAQSKKGRALYSYNYRARSDSNWG